MIGAKSLTSIGVFLFLTSLVLYSGRLDSANPVMRDPQALFWIALVACFAGVMIVRVGRVEEPSHTSFRVMRRDRRFDTDITMLQNMPGRFTIGECTDVPPRDLPPVVQRLLWIIAFFWVGIMALDSRSLAMLNAPAVENYAGYCKPPEAEPEKQEVDPSNVGCELVERAFRLGYVSSLGDCGKKAGSKDQKGPCDLRQLDEPYLHYSWRLLARQFSSMPGITSPDTWEKMYQELNTRFMYLDSLYGLQRRSVTAGQRAAHLLWTNLPEPARGIKGFLPPGPTQDWRRVLNQPGPGSELMELILGQLLLLADYKPAVEYPEELNIHWGAPLNACEELVRDPAAFLQREGLLDKVRTLIALVGQKAEIDALFGNSSGNTSGNSSENSSGNSSGNSGSLFADTAAVQRMLTFQCFVEDKKGDGRVLERPFTLDGIALQAAEIRLPPANKSIEGQKDLFLNLAKLFVPTFHYGRFLSQISAGEEEEEAPPKGDLYLARLETLRDVDLFLAPAWLWERPDLLEVYPFHVHLKNFIEIFRRQYKAIRGRL